MSLLQILLGALRVNVHGSYVVKLAVEPALPGSAVRQASICTMECGFIKCSAAAYIEYRALNEVLSPNQ